MDEADKYKQRLEAIAEKLRLQEEQEKARREKEEERLRVQQLKRKSLRDQWLMEGAPLSPASLDTQNPRSPLWGSEAQKMEEHDDQNNCGLQAEIRQLTEEEEESPAENRQMQEAAEMEDAGAESTGDAVIANLRPLLEETATLFTNHRGEADASPDSLDSNQSSSSGPVAASASRDGLRTSASEGGPEPSPTISVEEEEPVLMIAEGVALMDEVDEEPEVIEGQIKCTQAETDPQKQEIVGEEIKRGAEEKHETNYQCSSVTITAAVSPSPAGGEMQKPPIPLGATVVSTVPVYSRSNTTFEGENHGAAAVTQEEADITSETQEPPTLTGQFQEGFQVVPQNKWREGMPGKQESLLSQAKTPKSHTEAAAAVTSAPSDTKKHGGKSKMPQNRTDLCCTVM